MADEEITEENHFPPSKAALTVRLLGRACCGMSSMPASFAEWALWGTGGRLGNGGASVLLFIDPAMFRREDN
jgi:hypothetical protein